MGVVQRQGIKNIIVRFAGVVIGIVSMLYVYSLDDAIYGYVQFLYNTALFFVPFISVGVLTLVIRFFPEFSKDSPKNRGFLSYLIILALSFFLIFIGIAGFFKEPIYRFLSVMNLNVEVIKANEFYIISLSFILIFILLFTNYTSNFGRIVVPTFLQNFLFKIFLPLVILAYVFEKISEKDVVHLIILFYGIVLILIIVYTGKLNALKFGWEPKFLTRDRVKRMFSYMVFGAFNGIGSALTFRIDAIMITTLLSTASTGVYFKILIMASVIDIPTHSINKIAGPIIAKAWEEGDKQKILDIYKKASINLLISGLAIFIVGWFTLDDLFAISIRPESFIGGKTIFLFLALGKLLDMLTSVNNSIIVFSKYYRYNLMFIVILGITNVILNYILIGKFNVIGAAIASCFALFLFNLIKLIFIYIKFGMHPFSKPTVILLVISGFVFLIFHFFPDISNPFLSIIINASLIIGIYGSLVYYFKISKEVNELIDKFVSKIL